MNQSNSIEIVNRATAYFNDIGSGRRELKREDMALYFDEDVQSFIDNQLMVSGIDGFCDRLTEMKDVVRFWEAMPCDISLSDGNNAAGRYVYRFENRDGEEGIIDILAIWTLRDGKMYRMIEHTLRRGAGISLQARK
jgi:hypothetical protein